MPADERQIICLEDPLQTSAIELVMVAHATIGVRENQIVMTFALRLRQLPFLEFDG